MEKGKAVERIGLMVETISLSLDVLNYRCVLVNHLEILCRKLSLEFERCMGCRQSFSLWYFLMAHLANSYRGATYLSPLWKIVAHVVLSRLLPPIARLNSVNDWSGFASAVG